MTNVTPGLIGESSIIVEETHTARHFGSGRVDGLATPMMIALMEDAASTSVDSQLDPGQVSVGVDLHVSHIAATPVGMRVTAKSELVAVDGRKLTFKVEAFDEKDKIGEGTHVRAIINIESFMARLEAKAKS